MHRVTNTVHTPVDAHAHTHTHKTHYTLQCSFLGWMCWQMTLFNTVSSALCFASIAMGHSQVLGGKEQKREKQRATERERESESERNGVNNLWQHTSAGKK